MSYTVPKIKSEKHYIRNTIIILMLVAALKLGCEEVHHTITDFNEIEFHIPKGDYSQGLEIPSPSQTAAVTQALPQEIV